MSDHYVGLPDQLYQAVRRQADAEDKTADALVIEWVAERVDDLESKSSQLDLFQQQAAAFQRMKPELLELYAGQYVAVRQGEVVASGKDKLDVSRQVRAQYGPGGYYVALVTVDEPRTVRMLSPRVVRE